MAIDEGYRYYYMGLSVLAYLPCTKHSGYYIHSCTKMKYKRDFHPTYVLDPESYEWTLLDKDLLARMEARKYVSLSRERRLQIGPGDPDPESAEGKSTPLQNKMY
jgi:hypothetical protein